ncbi:hypothetical protein [Maliponia aquimaris]|uniref:hypothetical protein n=1 Tax=Maliponia aquimaris TaxID=1673631 RepID=UPI0011405EFA|nr:hypothetical protein [Maliponia aquimaris]
MIETWIRAQTINADGSLVFRLTEAKSRIPREAFVTGTAPSIASPPPGAKTISITWPDGVSTEHFVRGDTNKYMITDRTDAAKKHLAPHISYSGQKIAITAISDGEFIVSLLEE